MSQTGQQIIAAHITHIAQYLKKQRQPDNEIRPVNRVQHEKYFSLKITPKIW